MEHVTFELPAGTFHALQHGEGTRPLVFLHGFPDHPPTAEAFFAALAARGYRVLAPWLRGYAPSPRVAPYDQLTLAHDVIALIDRWAPDGPVDLVGHDWGAAITYLVCTLAPHRIRRAVTMAVPHPRAFVHQLRRPSQLARSWYMAFFQLPGSDRPAAWLIDTLWRRWSPGFRLDEQARAALRDTLASSMPAPLEYYRDARRHARRLLAMKLPPIETPLLALHGADDGCVLPPSAADARREQRYFAADFVRETLPGRGHFMHLEDPAGIAQRIADWLA